MKTTLSLLASLLCMGGVVQSAVLNFGDSTYTDLINPADGSGEMRWVGITSQDGEAIDMVVTVGNGSTYNPGNGPDNANGPLPSTGADAGSEAPNGGTRVRVAWGSEVVFRFSFVLQGTDQEVVLDETSISFWDIDEARFLFGLIQVPESVRFVGVEGDNPTASYTLTTESQVILDESISEQPVFSSGSVGTADDNPRDLTAATAEEQQKAVQFNFENVSAFSVNLAVGGLGLPFSTPFLIGGEVPFTEPTTTRPIPEPSTALLLAGGMVMGVLRRRRPES